MLHRFETCPIDGELFTKACKEWDEDVWTKWGEFFRDQTCEFFENCSSVSSLIHSQLKNSRMRKMTTQTMYQRVVIVSRRYHHLRSRQMRMVGQSSPSTRTSPFQSERT